MVQQTALKALIHNSPERAAVRMARWIRLEKWILYIYLCI